MDVEIYGHLNFKFLVDLPDLEDTPENRAIARLALAKATDMPARLCKAFYVDKIKRVENEEVP